MCAPSIRPFDCPSNSLSSGAIVQNSKNDFLPSQENKVPGLRFVLRVFIVQGEGGRISSRYSNKRQDGLAHSITSSLLFVQLHNGFDAHLVMRERIDSSVGTHNKREEMKDMCVALGRKCRTPPPGQPGIKLVCRPAPISQSSPAKTFTVTSAFSARFLQQHTFNKQFLEYLLSVQL